MKRRDHHHNIENWKKLEEAKLVEELEKLAEERKIKLLDDELNWKLQQEEDLRLRLLREEEER